MGHQKNQGVTAQAVAPFSFDCEVIVKLPRGNEFNLHLFNDPPYHQIVGPLLLMLRFPHPPVDHLLIPLWNFRVVPIAVDLSSDCLIFGRLIGRTIGYHPQGDRGIMGRRGWC